MAAVEKLKDDQLFFADVLYIMKSAHRNVANIPRSIVEGSGLRARHKYCHPGFALDIILKFIVIGVPMNFTHGARFHFHHCAGYRGAGREVSVIQNADAAPLSHDRFHMDEFVFVGVWNFAVW